MSVCIETVRPFGLQQIEVMAFKRTMTVEAMVVTIGTPLCNSTRQSSCTDDRRLH